MPTSISATSGPSTRKNALGDAIYEWARSAKDAGDVFTQPEIFTSGLIPDNELKLLLDAAQYLVNRRLFRAVDIKGQQGIGWELVEETAAANYGGLTADEQMVYASIDAVGTAGIWTKNIKAKSGVHSRVLDGVYKSLEKKGLIKTMKSVKHPQRKMYIRAGLTPSEEATGGTWFNEGRLDIGMIDAVTQAIETFSSLQSWIRVDNEDNDSITDLKRKQTMDGLNGSGREKSVKLEHGHAVQPVNSHSRKRQYKYEPHMADYQSYPTLSDFSKELRDKEITQLTIPNNALQQLLDVMVYDDKLYRLERQARSDEQPNDPDRNIIFMYKCFTTPFDLGQRLSRESKIKREDRNAIRAQELEDIGMGGFTEVPCSNCPVFEICGDGGPVNIQTCTYMMPWIKNMEDADAEIDDLWPTVAKARIVRPKAQARD